MQKEQTLNRGVPKTVLALESDLKALKSDSSSMESYLCSIPASSIETIFKRTEVNAEVLTTILESVKTFESAENKSKGADLLLSLAKGSNFDMTLMFAEEADKLSI